MSTSSVPRRRPSPADIVGIPAEHLVAMLDHVLATDALQTPPSAGLLGIVRTLGDAMAHDHGHSQDGHGDDTGHEDILPQLRVVTAMLERAVPNDSAPLPPPFQEMDAVERRRRRRRKEVSLRHRPPDTLPPPSAQAENDRLLLEEIGTPINSPDGGWTAEPAPSVPEPPPQDIPPLPAAPLTDEVMESFIPAEPPAPAPPPTIKVHQPKRRKRVVPPAQPVEQSQPAPVITAAMEPPPLPPSEVEGLKIKLKPKRKRMPAPPEPPPVAAAPAIPEPEPEPEPVFLAPPEPQPEPEPVFLAPPEPEPEPEPVFLAPPEPEPEPEPVFLAPPEPQPEPEPVFLAPPEPEPEPEPIIDVAPPSLLAVRVEAIIAAYHPAAAPLPLKSCEDSDLPADRDALAALLDDHGPDSDFAALDLLYKCWGKVTQSSSSRALLAVAHQLSRNFGLPGKLPMASCKAWKMLDCTTFAPELAQRLADVGQFIADWQKTQRVFLILEYSEIELIEHLFEALSPADYSSQLAEVMNYKVLSNRRMGLLRRIPARARRQTQGLPPERKEEALLIQAHYKTLLERIADPRGFAPIVEVAGKMIEEMEKLMKQTAGAQQLPGPPGGGQSLGRIG